MATEVGAKLVLDDAASSALEHIKQGFEKVNETVHDAQHEMMGFVKQMLATAAGFQLSNGIESLKELGHEALGSAIEVQTNERALAGVLAMSDKAGKGLEELTADAHGLREELEETAIKTGTSTAVLVDVFSEIASRSNKGTEAVKEMTKQIALAGKILPGGAEQLANSYRDMEIGIVRPRNAIVQLIKQTGVAHGTTRDIAKGLSNLIQTGQQEKAFKLAEEAIDRMAKKMKDAPPTFNSIIASLKDVREKILESLGMPILQALAGPLNELRQYFINNRKSIEDFAHSLGVKVGNWVKEAAKKVQEGFQYLVSHADEIESAIKRGAEAAMAVVKFILDHKEALAIAFGAKMVAPGVIGAAKLAGGIGGDILGVAKAGIPALGMAGIGGGAMAAVATLGAVAAAIIAVGAAAYQAYKLMGELQKAHDDDKNARVKELERAAKEGGNVDSLQKIRDALVTTNPELATYANGLMDQAVAANRASEQFQSAADSASASAEANADASTNALLDMFADASARGNQAQMEYVAKLIAGNDEIVESLRKGGDKFDSVAMSLAETIDKLKIPDRNALAIAQNIAGTLAGDQAKKSKMEKAGGMNANFYGAQFHIKQDFRDQDPDRIAAVFREDVVKNAVARTQSKLATPFGF